MRNVYIKDFKQSGLIEILVMLKVKDLKISEITETIHPQSAYRSVGILEKLDLLEIRRGDYNRKFHCLTAKGKKVAELLVRIEEILQGIKTDYTSP